MSVDLLEHRVFAPYRTLAFVVLPAVLVANALCAVGSFPGTDRATLSQTRAFVRGRAGSDSWWPMQQALKMSREQPDNGIYQTLFFEKGVKFQYPISSLLFVAPVERFAGPSGARPVLNLISFLTVLATAVVCGQILVTASAAGACKAWRRWPTMALSVALVLLFYPVVKSGTLGQIQSWICLFFVSSVYFVLTGRWKIAAILLGLACLIKPQLGLVIVWATVRRRWQFVGTALAILGVGVLVTGLSFGWREQIEYLRVLRFIGERGESYFPNHSFNGLLNRLFFNGSNLEWTPHGFPAPMKAVSVGTLLTSAAMILVALFWRRCEHKAAPVVDFCIIALIATVASPVAWEHHYGVMVGMYAVTLPSLLKYRPFGRWTSPMLLTSFVIAGSFIPAVQRLASSRANILQSYILFAALLFLAMLFALRHTMALLAARNLGGRQCEEGVENDLCQS